MCMCMLLLQTQLHIEKKIKMLTTTIITPFIVSNTSLSTT